MWWKIKGCTTLGIKGMKPKKWNTTVTRYKSTKSNISSASPFFFNNFPLFLVYIHLLRSPPSFPNSKIGWNTRRPETVTEILHILYSFIPISNYWCTNVFASPHLISLDAFRRISTWARIISTCGYKEGHLSEESRLIQGGVQ